jgi:hypothetical protein
MNPKITHLKRATAVTVVAALVLCQGYVTGTPLSQVASKLRNYVVGTNTALPRAGVTKLPKMAQLSSSGAVTLNGMNAPDGATVFSGSGVKTTETSTATLSLGTTQVALAQSSDFTLAVEGTTLGGQLRAGRASIVAPAGVAVKIVTADGPVLADGREATNLTIDVTAGKTRVETSGSRAEATAAAGDEGATDAPAGATAQSETQKTLAELREAARAAAAAAADAAATATDANSLKSRVRNAALNAADALTLAEAKADAGNGGGGPGLKDTLQFMLSVAGVVTGLVTLREVQKQDTLSPMR